MDRQLTQLGIPFNLVLFFLKSSILVSHQIWFRKPNVLGGFQVHISDNAQEHCDFPAVVKNIHRSTTAINKPPTQRIWRG
jgi:hypothetical protein